MQIELWPIGVAQCLRFTMTSISKWEVPLCSSLAPTGSLYIEGSTGNSSNLISHQSQRVSQHYCCSINATASLLFLQFSSLGPQGLPVQVVSVPKIENSFFFSSVLPPPFSLSQTTSSPQGHGCNGQGSQGHDGHGHGGHDHGLSYPICRPFWSNLV